MLWLLTAASIQEITKYLCSMLRERERERSAIQLLLPLISTLALGHCSRRLIGAGRELGKLGDAGTGAGQDLDESWGGSWAGAGQKLGGNSAETWEFGGSRNGVERGPRSGLELGKSWGRSWAGARRRLGLRPLIIGGVGPQMRFIFV